MVHTTRANHYQGHMIHFSFLLNNCQSFKIYFSRKDHQLHLHVFRCVDTKWGYFFVMGWRDFQQKNKWNSSTIKGRRIVLVSNILCIQMVGMGLSLWNEDVPLWSTISVFICAWNINLHRRLEQKKHYLWDYFYL